MSEDDHQRTFRLEGELDLATVEPLREVLQAVPPGCREVVVDIGGITFLDSSGIAGLVRIRRFHQQAGRACAVVGAVGQPARVLELTGLDELARLVERWS